MKKIALIGSGKSTLTQRSGEKLNIKVYDLDAPFGSQIGCQHQKWNKEKCKMNWLKKKNGLLMEIIPGQWI